MFQMLFTLCREDIRLLEQYRPTCNVVQAETVVLCGNDDAEVGDTEELTLWQESAPNLLEVKIFAGEVRNARRRCLGDGHEAFGVGLFPLIASAGVFIQVEVFFVQRLYLPQKVEIKRKSTGVWKTNQFHKFLSIHWFYNHRNGFFCAIHGSMSAKVTGTITAERSVRSGGTQIERQ